MLTALVFLHIHSFAQCPPNIGFELGNFDNWECSIGSISQNTGDITLTASRPASNRHTLIQSDVNQIDDFYGGFPVSCPNGSGYSIQLGNPSTGRQAERVSYTFTIPSDQNNYSIIYNYAVVFQNPGHADWEQPKFTANVFDVTNGTYIGCSSFSYAASSNLPGFKESTVKDSVFYKDWTPVTIKLSGYAGRTIRLEFTTNDCTRGGHFGYAYIDVNENCSSPISGNIYCLNDASQKLIAPYGFEGYKWFNKDFSKVLGNEITLVLSPVAAPNTVLAVEVTPYPDQGCVDTVYTTIQLITEPLTLVTKSLVEACVNPGVNLTVPLITSGSSAGLSLSYFLDSSLTGYLPNPRAVTKNGVYYIKATNTAGCISAKPISVKIYDFPVFTVTDPKAVTRPSTINLQSTIGGNTTGVVFSFWQDQEATRSVSQPDLIGKTGTYYIKGTNAGGCAVTEAVNIVVNEPVIIPPNAFSPNGDGVHDNWEIPLIYL
ncbi:MAG: hypothetical protein RLZZ28_560, partial [Bacteroidota bacterium]